MKTIYKYARYKSPNDPILLEEVEDEIRRREGSLVTDVDMYPGYLENKFEFHSLTDLKKTYERQRGKKWESS